MLPPASLVGSLQEHFATCSGYITEKAEEIMYLVVDFRSGVNANGTTPAHLSLLRDPKSHVLPKKARAIQASVGLIVGDPYKRSAKRSEISPL